MAAPIPLLPPVITANFTISSPQSNNPSLDGSIVIMANRRTHPVSIDTRNRIVWKSANFSRSSITAMFTIAIIPAAPRNQISSMGLEIAKHANHTRVSCTDVLVVVSSENREGNE